jgi:hypothetical protein
VGFFVVLKQIVQVREDLAAAGEISHEVRLQLGKVRGRMERRGLVSSTEW